MISELAREENQNLDVARYVVNLTRDDEHLSEKSILPEDLQTLGYMRSIREGFDFLGSVDAVIHSV